MKELKKKAGGAKPKKAWVVGDGSDEASGEEDEEGDEDSDLELKDEGSVEPEDIA